MWEIYWWSNWKKYIPKSKLKKIKKQMQKSYQKWDILKKENNKIMKKEKIEADEFLKNNLNIL